MSLPVCVRTRLQIDGPYNEAFLEKVQKCSMEDDHSAEFAVAKVRRFLLTDACRLQTSNREIPRSVQGLNMTNCSVFWLQVHQYRVAMTAKDCSIMVALVPSDQEEDDDEG